MRAPRQHAGLRNPASSLEINQANLLARYKNVLRFAVAPHVPSRVNRAKKRTESIQQLRCPPPRISRRFFAIFAKQRTAGNCREHEIAIAVLCEFTKWFGNWHAAAVKFTQNSALTL